MQGAFGDLRHALVVAYEYEYEYEYRLVAPTMGNNRQMRIQGDTSACGLAGVLLGGPVRVTDLLHLLVGRGRVGWDVEAL